MSHDRFCPATPCQCDDVTCDYCGGCRCDLITRVRGDEQSLIRLTKTCREQVSKAYGNGYRTGRIEAAEAVKSLAADWPPHHTDYVVRTALARAAILAEGKLNAIPAS